jgi:hypothetical protein
MATATPLGPPGPRRRRSSTPGCSSWTRSHLPPESVFPRPRKVAASVRRAYIRDTSAASGPEPEPERILIPGDGAAGYQEAQDRPACPAIEATRRLRPVPSQRLPNLGHSSGQAVRSHTPTSAQVRPRCRSLSHSAGCGASGWLRQYAEAFGQLAQFWPWT